MAIDEKQADQVRAALADAGSVREVKMFGGLGFMLNGNMVAAPLIAACSSASARTMFRPR